MPNSISGAMWSHVEALRPGVDASNPYYPGTIRETVPACLGAFGDQTGILTSGVMTLVAVPLYPGDVIRGMAVRVGGTSAASPTNSWFALYDPSLALITQTADQGSAAWSSSSTKDLTFQSAVTVTKAGVYYAAIMVAAGTTPSLVSHTFTTVSISTGLVSGMTQLAGTAGSSLTSTAPASVTLGTIAHRFYGVLHS